MEWMTAIRESIRYMEDNIITVSGPAEIADHVSMSEMYLQRGFQVVTGLTLGEYVRNRRLYLAAIDLIRTDDKVIDIALRYGYETPESFTKAFGRFHDASPTQIRRGEKSPRTFMPMRISMVVKGGSEVDVRIEEHDSIELIGKPYDMPFEEHLEKIPRYLDEYEQEHEDMLRGLPMPQKAGRSEKAMYDNRIGDYDAFTGVGAKEGWCRFMIAGIYAGGDVPDGMEVWQVPGCSWAKFSCEGPLHPSTINIKKYIWYEWLPGNIEYELGGDYFISKYCRTKSTTSIDYECELWIPVRKRDKAKGKIT